MKRDMTRFLSKTVFFVLPVFIGFEVLFRLGFFPIATNSGYFDNKMLLLQKHPLKSVRLLAIGSSITAYSLDSRVIVQHIDLPYYNFGSWNMQIGDMRIVLKALVEDYRPEYVLILSSFGDFNSGVNPTYANYTETPHFIRTHFPEYFYFSDYHSIHQLFLRRYKASHLGIDAWGRAREFSYVPGMDSVQDSGRSVDWDTYIFNHGADRQLQYRELDSLGADLQSEAVRLVFAQAPMRPSFMSVDPMKQVRERHFETCRSIVERHGGVYFNYYDTAVFREEMFFDRMHLTDEGAEMLTKKLVEDLKGVIK
jgi:hypothetical protein